MFTVPKLEELMSKHVIVATCGATRLLAEAGITPVHLNMAQYGLNMALFREVGSVNLMDRLQKDGHFTHILIDEASQGLEPEILMPLSFAYPGASTALCGDHKQLGPVVRSAFCRTNGLATSILERLTDLDVYKQQGGGASSGAPAAENGAAPEAAPADNVAASDRPRCVTKLVRNYRSHAALLELPSRISYGGELQEHADREVTGSMAGWNELIDRDFPLLFYGCASAHSLYKIDPSSAHPSSSYRNVTEAEKIVELIHSIQEKMGVSTNDIGVVTPFRAQVLHIRQKLRSLDLGAIRVGTVDDYQGQEELIIIISTVIGSANPRSVAAMGHGLMSSPQRFNVAITRAKALLVIVGDPNALWEDVSWRELLQYSVDHASYRGCAHPLAMQGAEDDSLDALAGLIQQAAQLHAPRRGRLEPDVPRPPRRRRVDLGQRRRRHSRGGGGGALGTECPWRGENDRFDLP